MWSTTLKVSAAIWHLHVFKTNILWGRCYYFNFQTYFLFAFLFITPPLLNPLKHARKPCINELHIPLRLILHHRTLSSAFPRRNVSSNYRFAPTYGCGFHASFFFRRECNRPYSLLADVSIFQDAVIPPLDFSFDEGAHIMKKHPEHTLPRKKCINHVCDVRGMFTFRVFSGGKG